jgi:mutator protein MutT
MNSELYNKTYKIPNNIIKNIQATLISNPKSEGIRRAKNIINGGVLTYQGMKRLKNFFDYFNPQSDDKIQYALAGGDLMKSFIEQTLSSDRNAVETSKDVKRDMTVDVNLGVDAYQTPRLNEEKKELKKNALAVIVNNDNKILLLKRANEPKSWMPEKWALVGGGVEKGETPEQAVNREIKEETNLDIDKFVKSFNIQRNPDSIEQIFACRYNGDPTDIQLNPEHTNYGWFDMAEMNYLDIVPNLINYINLVFKQSN